MLQNDKSRSYSEERNSQSSRRSNAKVPAMLRPDGTHLMPQTTIVRPIYPKLPAKRVENNCEPGVLLSQHEESKIEEAGEEATNVDSLDNSAWIDIEEGED